MNQAMAEVLRSTAITPESSTSSEPAWAPSLDAYHPDLVQAARTVARFVADMARGAPPYWLTLSGTPGTGKTMLARQILAQAEKLNPGSYVKNPVWYAGQGIYSESHRRPKCVWMEAIKFAERLKSGEYDLPESFGPDFFIAFDDLGASRDKTDFVPEAIYRLACHQSGKWTVWTTNLQASEIAARMDPRIASRLVRDENKFITLSCSDYALVRK